MHAHTLNAWHHRSDYGRCCATVKSGNNNRIKSVEKGDDIYYVNIPTTLVIHSVCVCAWLCLNIPNSKCTEFNYAFVKRTTIIHIYRWNVYPISQKHFALFFGVTTRMIQSKHKRSSPQMKRICSHFFPLHYGLILIFLLSTLFRAVQQHIVWKLLNVCSTHTNKLFF